MGKTAAIEKFKKRLGRRIETRRIELKLSRSQVSKKAKLPAGQLYHYETGGRLPGALILFKICKALEVSADEILGL